MRAYVVPLVLLMACNNVPGAPGITIDPEAPTTLDTLTLRVVSPAIDDDPPEAITYQVTWLRNGISVPELSGALEVPPTFTRKGDTWEASVRASDGRKDSEPTSASTVISNSAPTLDVRFVEPSPLADEDLVAVVDAQDPDDDPIDVQIAWLRDGVDSGITGDRVAASQTERGQRWTVQVSASDGEADPVTAEASIDVANSPPEVYNLSMVPEPLRTLDNAKVSFSVRDEDGDPVSTRQVWQVNGVQVDVTGQTLPASTFQRGDEIRVGVTGNDGFVDGDTVWFSTLVENTPARVDSAALDPRRIDETTEVRCVGTGWFDADGDPESYLTTWYVNGTVVAVTETLTGASFDRGDAVSCDLVPFDGITDSDPVPSTSLTVSNAAPTLDGVSIGPADPLATDVITATLGATEDLDGDEVAIIVEWQVNGTRVSTGSTLDGGSFRGGDTIELVARPVDGFTTGAAVRSNVLTAANNPPVVTSVTLTGGDLYTDDVITATVAASDHDGDPIDLSYAWYVDGTLVGGASDATLDGALYFDRDQEVYVLVTPDDGTEDGASVSSDTVDILNSAPLPPALASSPSDPSDTDALQCVLDELATDADDDVLTYTFTWYDDGVVSSKGTRTLYTNDTIPASARYDGDQWTCEVVASDGTDDSEAVSLDITGPSGPFTFGTCGATGQDGPSQSQCDSAYASTDLDGLVTVSGGIQTWTVPRTGDYTIEVTGAAGAHATSGYTPGYGAYVAGTFALTKGDELTLIVGQRGTSDGTSGGGGGGSFVLDDKGSALIIAGGGGGVRSGTTSRGCSATTGTTGGRGSGSATTWSCPNKTSGFGLGGIASAYSWGSAGGGLNSDGAWEYSSVNGGKAPKNGASGGGSSTYRAFGGFGGGGSGNGAYGGGGGGGYTGGDGGRLAGGGGSYNTGSSQTATAGLGSANGQIVITQE